MLDEMQRLGESESLQRLVDHYAVNGVDDRMVWHDRLMELESVTASEPGCTANCWPPNGLR